VALFPGPIRLDRLAVEDGRADLVDLGFDQ
jgi:hypothetical protein